MGVWFESLTVLEKVFASLAVLGGGLFLIRVVMAFVGLGGDDGDGSADAAHGDAGGGDADHGGGGAEHDAGHTGVHDMMSFKLLSFQGLTGFFMMFGLVGLGLSRSLLGTVTALIGATLAGLALVWIVDRLFRLFSQLQDSGTLDLRNAIHQEGSVYLTIPVGEVGKVQVTVQGTLKVLDARAEDRQEIPTDTRVRVVDVVNQNILVVKRI